MPEPPQPLRTADEITAERIGRHRAKLLRVIEHGYGHMLPDVLAAVTECMRNTMRDIEHHVYLKNTLPQPPPDPDRARTPVEPRSDPERA